MVILASASPRREELLKKIFADFVIEVCEDEELHTAETPKDLAVKNAKHKAESVAKKHLQDIVIGADTIVTMGGKIFEKPVGEVGACEMLKTLSGKMHEVITGLAIVHGGKTFTDFEVTEVYFGEMTFLTTLRQVNRSTSPALTPCRAARQNL